MKAKSGYSPFKPIGHWPTWREAQEKAEEMSRLTGKSWTYVPRADGLWAIQRKAY